MSDTPQRHSCRLYLSKEQYEVDEIKESLKKECRMAVALKVPANELGGFTYVEEMVATGLMIVVEWIPYIPKGK